MDTDHVQILLEIKADVAATRQMVEDIKGPNGRLEKLEERMDTADNRQWLKAMVIAPAMVVLHAAARKLGLAV